MATCLCSSAIAASHAAHFTYLTSARPSFAQVLKERGAAAAARAESMACSGRGCGRRARLATIAAPLLRRARCEVTL